MKHPLLSVLPETTIQNDDPLVAGIMNVEQDGIRLAMDMIALGEEHSTRALATIMYAASIVTLLEKGVDPQKADLFSDLPVREQSVIKAGYILNNMSVEERAAIYARESIKLIMQPNIQGQN